MAALSLANLPPVHRCFFCRTCQRVLDPDADTQAEIECRYCPTCLSELPAAQAALFLGRCWQCAQCPLCATALGTVAYPGDGSAARYALACPYCQWDSRHLDLPDDAPESILHALVKREKEDPAVAAVRGLCKDLNRAVTFSRREKAMRGRPLAFRPLSQGKGASASGAAASGAGTATEPTDSADSADGDAADDDAPVNNLPSATTGLEQRFLHPLHPEQDARKLYPARTPLFTKLSKRCRHCERVVLKPDPNPKSAKFKLASLAMAYIPGARRTADGLLELTNPMDEPMAVTIAGLSVDLAAFNEIDDYDDDGKRTDDPDAVVSRSKNTVVLKVPAGAGPELTAAVKAGPVDTEVVFVWGGDGE